MDEEKLLLYWSGELDPGEAWAVERAIEHDEAAQQYLAELEALRASVPEQSTPTPPISVLDDILAEDLTARRRLARQRPKRPSRLPALLVGSGIAAAVAIGIWLSSSDPEQLSTPSMPSVVEIDAPEATPTKRALSQRLFASDDRRFSTLRESRDRRNQFKKTKRRT